MAQEDLRELVEQSLIPKAALARACGISRQYLYEVLLGRWRPGERILVLLARHLKISRKTVDSALAVTRRRAGK